MNLFSIMVDGRPVGLRVKWAGDGFHWALSVRDLIYNTEYKDSFNKWMKEGGHIKLLDKVIDAEGHDMEDLCYIHSGNMYINPTIVGYFIQNSGVNENSKAVGTRLITNGGDGRVIPLPSFIYHIYARIKKKI